MHWVKKSHWPGVYRNKVNIKILYEIVTAIIHFVTIISRSNKAKHNNSQDFQ